MKNNYMMLAEIIKNRRISLGFSLRNLANEVGISHTELVRIENGNRQCLNVITLIRLCKLLELDFLTLLEDTNFYEREEEKLFYVIVKNIDTTVFRIHATNEIKAVTMIIDLIKNNDVIKKDKDIKNTSIFATCEKKVYETILRETQLKTEEQLAQKYNKKDKQINEITTEDLEDMYDELENDFDDEYDDESNESSADIEVYLEVVKK